MRRKKGFFSISAVAEMFSVHPQTIRLYEQEGLINPKRTGGNTRIFSEDDVNKLEEIVYLTHHLGINLAGVEMVLKLKKQVKKMQKEMNAAFEKAKDELTQQETASKTALKEDVSRLMAIRKKAPRLEHKESDHQEDSSSDDWEIEYEK